MCGLVGVASTLVDFNKKKAFNSLLYLDAVRGWDSTGVAMVKGGVDKKLSIAKKALAAADFIGTKQFDDMIKSTNIKLLIGHNRAATKGKVVDSNAHPFNHGHITMVHNGTLNSWSTLPKRSKKHDFLVDSEAICHALSCVDDPKEVLEKLNGAYALVWYNQREDSLNFARNDERPLHFAIADKGKSMYWASEEGMLNWVLDRHKIGGDPSMYELVDGYHMKFSMDTKLLNFDEAEENKFEPMDNWGGLGNNVRIGTNSPEARMLRKYKLKQGDKIRIIFDLYKPHSYVGSTKGNFYGKEETTGAEVICYSQEANAVNLGEVYEGRYAYATTAYNEYEPAAVVRAPTLAVDEPAADKEVQEKVDESGEHANQDGSAAGASGDSRTASSEVLLEDENMEEQTTDVVVPFRPTVFPGPRGGENISQKLWDEYTKHGCAYCGGNFEDSEADSIVWMGRDSPVHSECYVTMSDFDHNAF